MTTSKGFFEILGNLKNLGTDNKSCLIYKKISYISMMILER